MNFLLLKWDRTLLRPLVWLGQAALSATLLNLSAVAPHASAQIATWSNSAGGDWSVGSNWVGGITPAPGATTALVFGSPATQSATYTATNDGADGFELKSLTFNNTAGAVELTGGGLSFAGVDPTLTQSGAGAADINTPVTLRAATTVAGNGTGAVTFNGAVNGSQESLVKTSDGSLTLAGGGSLNVLELAAGTTNVTDGTLTLNRADHMAASLVLGERREFPDSGRAPAAGLLSRLSGGIPHAQTRSSAIHFRSPNVSNDLSARLRP